MSGASERASGRANGPEPYGLLPHIFQPDALERDGDRCFYREDSSGQRARPKAIYIEPMPLRRTFVDAEGVRGHG